MGKNDVQDTLTMLPTAAAMVDRLIAQSRTVPAAKVTTPEYQRFVQAAEIAQEALIRLRDAANTARSRVQPNVLTPEWQGIMNAFPMIQYRFPETLDRPIPGVSGLGGVARVILHDRRSFEELAGGGGLLESTMPALTTAQAAKLAPAMPQKATVEHANTVGLHIEAMASALHKLGQDVSWVRTANSTSPKPSTATPPGSSMLATSSTGTPADASSGTGAMLLLLVLGLGLALIVGGRAR